MSRTPSLNPRSGPLDYPSRGVSRARSNSTVENGIVSRPGLSLTLARRRGVLRGRIYSTRSTPPGSYRFLASSLRSQILGNSDSLYERATERELGINTIVRRTISYFRAQGRFSVNCDTERLAVLLNRVINVENGDLPLSGVISALRRSTFIRRTRINLSNRENKKKETSRSLFVCKNENDVPKRTPHPDKDPDPPVLKVNAAVGKGHEVLAALMLELRLQCSKDHPLQTAGVADSDKAAAAA